jgi:hypothetical protein
MNKVMIRYKVKPERAQENTELIRAVYEELALTAPAGLRYATFVLEDGVSFVHVTSNETDGPTPLREVQAFQEFQKDVTERCAEGPVSSEMQEIGSYRFWQ